MMHGCGDVIEPERGRDKRMALHPFLAPRASSVKSNPKSSQDLIRLKRCSSPLCVPKTSHF